MEFKEHVECFVKLLDNFHVAEFLKRDPCGALADKYHLVTVFQFFMRAEFNAEDYTPRNFFLALTLSHDIYDELKVLNKKLLKYYLTRNDGVKNKTKIDFHIDKLRLFKKMKYKAVVEKKICQNLLRLIPHEACRKSRKELHTGIINNEIICNKCHCPKNSLFSSNDEGEKSCESDKENTEKNIIKTPRDLKELPAVFTTPVNYEI